MGRRRDRPDDATGRDDVAARDDAAGRDDVTGEAPFREAADLDAVRHNVRTIAAIVGPPRSWPW